MWSDIVLLQIPSTGMWLHSVLCGVQCRPLLPQHLDILKLFFFFGFYTATFHHTSWLFNLIFLFSTTHWGYHFLFYLILLHYFYRFLLSPVLWNYLFYLKTYVQAWHFASDRRCTYHRFFSLILLTFLYSHTTTSITCTLYNHSICCR